MATLYELEPPTNGRILLKTTIGDVEIGLWSKEAPKACRNFVQLCMEGYYNNVIFHRVVPDFIIQTGDPTGTGFGGESIYDGPFKDEFHQRLKFSRRGLVAMANSGSPNTNLSQFFISLAPITDLNNKHTIFGHVIGNTMYNVLKILDLERDCHNKPLEPPKIIRSTILEQPFSDIVPRVKVENKSEDLAKEKQSIFKHMTATKNKCLLSFGDDIDEEEFDSFKSKSKSIHDAVTNDPTLSHQSVEVQPVEKIPSEETKKCSIAEAEKIEVDPDELKKRKLEEIKLEQKKIKKDMKKNMMSSIKKKKQVEKLKHELNEPGNEDEEESNFGNFNEYGNFDVGSVDDYLKVHLKYMVKSKKSKLNSKDKRVNREDLVLGLLDNFNKRLRDTATMGDYEEIGVTGDKSWMTHKLKFEKDYVVSNARDANVVNIDTYELNDPRNVLNKRDRKGKTI